jgi:carotenoid cleavage dioxygenase-like enzyme
MEKIAQANKCSCPVPESILKTDRWELNDIEMKIEGKLPDDIQGHVFIVAPVGTVESGGLPFPDGNSFMDGDGMVYRLDFDQPDQVNLKTGLLKPPDYYADKATRPGSKYDKYQFRDYGSKVFRHLLKMP